MKKTIKFLSLILVLVSVFVLFACKKNQEDPKTNEPAKTGEKTNNPDPTSNPTVNPIEEDITDLTVRDYIGENGVVAAANPYAAKAGLDILKAGGNAFDAAVAVSFALGVVEPYASGVGGGGIMVAYDATAGEYVSYNFREFVPKAGTPSAFTNQKDDLNYGAKAPGVPTQVAGLVTIEEERGVLTRQEVMAPAINYAKNGVTVTPELANQISSMINVVMMSRDEIKRVFLNEDYETLQAGETLVQKDYAHVLELISEKGKEGFYKGEVADAILASCGVEAGGLITQEDLDMAMNNYPRTVLPLTGNYKGYDIVTANTPSSGGIILIEALNMLECYGDLKALGHNSAEYINVVSTALQLAYGDKRKYIADQDFVDVPISGLCSKLYAAERWKKFTFGQAYLGRFQGDDDYGNPWPYCTKTQPVDYTYGDTDEHYSTTSFSVADKAGNIVSVTQTINHFFGCGVVPHGCGFYLNNQLTSFSFTSTSAAYIQPLKQPVSHIMPTIIMKDGDPYATLGSPGSMRIPSAVTETVLNLIVFGMNMQEAIAAPRFYSYACASTDIAQDAKDIYIENAVPQEVRDKLTAMGYNVMPGYETGEPINLFFGGVQGIKFIYESDGSIKLHGGADPRRDGKALGF